MNKPDPNNPETILVAGAVVHVGMAAEAAGVVTASDFQDRRLGAIWSAIVRLVNRGESDIDIVKICNEMGAKGESRNRVGIYISDLLDGFPRISSLVDVAKRVRSASILRMANAELIRLVSLSNDVESLPELEDRLSKLSIALSPTEPTDRTIFRDRMSEVSKYIDSLATGSKSSFVPTGIYGLDLKLGGGLRPGQMHTILGSTGSGKTALASQICDEAIRLGHRSMMFSMEVDPVDIYIRDVERNAGVSRWQLLTTSKKEAEEKLINSIATLSSKEGKTVYGEPISVEGIRQAVITEQMRHGPVKVVVVDHAQVALPSSDDTKRMPRYLEVKGTAEGLRALARKLHVAVVLTAQLNPSQKGEKPDMDKVRESKDINNCSEVVMVIEHKKELVNDETVIADSYIHIEKARAGRCGRVPIKYRGEIYRFEDQQSVVQMDDY